MAASSSILSAARGSPIIAVIGPTAVGKTTLAIELAQTMAAEIVSIDSRQIYRETTIGTAKPGPVELETVPHHLIGARSISNPVSAVEYASLARRIVHEIRARGNSVLLVGGSTLYIHALLYGLDDVPPTDPEIRQTLSKRLKTEGLAALQQQLEEVDPRSSKVIDLSNPRRVLRALEVYFATGQPISEFRKSPNLDETTTDTPLFVLNRPRDILYRRIERRVDSMYEDGLLQEVRAILASGHSPSLQALQTIGYRETIDHLAGEIDQAEMLDLVKRNTRRYAKRQLTWFRRYRNATWIDLGA